MSGSSWAVRQIAIPRAASATTLSIANTIVDGRPQLVQVVIISIGIKLRAKLIAAAIGHEAMTAEAENHHCAGGGLWDERDIPDIIIRCHHKNAFAKA